MSVEELVKRLRHTDEYEPLGHDGWEAADKLEELAAALAEKDKEIEALREALEAMLEPYEDDPCRHDHHGYCQAHFLELHCCVANAREALSLTPTSALAAVRDEVREEYKAALDKVNHATDREIGAAAIRARKETGE